MGTTDVLAPLSLASAAALTSASLGSFAAAAAWCRSRLVTREVRRVVQAARPR